MVRPATVDDARAVAEVHVRAWQAAYRGHMPDEFLYGLSVERRADWWTGRLAQERPERVWVAERAGAVVGIAGAGRPMDPAEDPGGAGQLWMINVIREAWGTGAGTLLLRAAVGHLRASGYRCAFLWVLDANARARRFYEREGWHADGATKLDDRGSFTLDEVRYRIDF